MDWESNQDKFGGGMFIFGLIIGLFVGVNLGIIFAALLFGSKRKQMIEETQLEESKVQKESILLDSQ